MNVKSIRLGTSMGIMCLAIVSNANIVSWVNTTDLQESQMYVDEYPPYSHATNLHLSQEIPFGTLSYDSGYLGNGHSANWETYGVASSALNIDTPNALVLTGALTAYAFGAATPHSISYSRTVAIDHLKFTLDDVGTLYAPYSGGGTLRIADQSAVNVFLSIDGIHYSGGQLLSLAPGTHDVTEFSEVYIIADNTANINSFYNNTGRADATFGISVSSGTPTPEPASMACLATGALGLISRRRRAGK